MAGENINRKLNIYINDKEVVNSATGINKALSSVRNQMKSLVKGTDEYDEKLKELKATYAQLKEEQAAFNEELELSSNNFGAARESAISFFTALASGDVATAQTALLGMRGAIIGTTKAAWAFVATPIGAFLVGLAGIAGVTKLWVNYNDEVYKANKLTNSITKLTGDNLDVVRVRAQALSETFDQDYTKVLETARALVNEFDISYTQALDHLESGLIKGGAANDEFLDSMREYPTFFANAGFSVEEFQNLVNSGIDLGIYQDKLPDAIKEFTLSVNEQTKASSDALRNAFGEEFTNTLLKGIKNGSISAKEALTLVSNEAERIGLNAQQAQQLTADLFRGAGEDAGGALRIFEAVRKSIADQSKPLNEVQQATDDLIESEKELVKVRDEALKSDGFARWKTFAITALNDVTVKFYNLIKAVTNTRAELLKAAKAEGLVKGEAVFQQQFNELNGKGMGSDAELAASIKSVALKEYRFYEKAYAENAKKLKEFNENAFRAARTYGVSESDLKDEKQKLTQSLNEKIAIIREANKKIKEQDTAGVTGTGGNNNSAVDQDAAKKAAEEAAKLREKELKDAQKHAEELIKQELELQKQLLATRRSAEDMKLGLIADDYEREKAIINSETNRKIEDFKANALKEQEEITKIKSELASSKTSKSDAAVLQKQLAERLEIQQIYNQSAVLSEQTRIAKLAALEEKYLQKSFQDQETKNARDLQNLKTKHTEELNSVKTLEDAKAVLAQYLSDDELGKVTSLSNAKKEIKKRFLKEEFDLQQQHLNDIMAKAREILGQTDEFGIELISGEEREKILVFLDEAAAKLAALGVKDPNVEKTDLSSLSGIDILGFTPEQWEIAFADLDTFDGKLKAIEATIGGLKNAFGTYFQFIETGEKRQLQTAERNYRKRTDELATQLERGYITQEVYNARMAKADQELAKKKAELEYKQAKREKAINIASIIANTAVGVSKAMAQGGFVLGVPWAGVIAALGAIQLGLAIAQPLPDKKGYYNGGFTGDGNPRSESTALGNKDYIYHKREYVIPNDVLFSNDPVVPNIVGYLEAKRTGKSTSNTVAEATNETTGSPSGSSDSALTTAVVLALDRNSDLIEELMEEGVIAYLENDIKTARKIRDKIKEVNKLENNAKA